MNPLLDAALLYARHSWPVIPLWWATDDGQCGCGKTDCGSPGKHPMGPLVLHGLKDATTDRKTIQRWWEQHPHANIGVVTGAGSGIFVLDIDPGSGGDQSLDDLESKNGRLPDTVESVTGGGGGHRVFRYPDLPIPSSTGKPGPGLDIRGDGGYIVAPPSNHVSGKTYSWDLSPEERDPVPAPQWMRDLVCKRNDSDGHGGTNSAAFKHDRSRPQEVVTAKDALAVLDSERADDYDGWIKVGMMLHSIDPGPEMLDIWDRWSQKSDRYEPNECAKRWETFNPDGGLTLATLEHWAKEDTNGKFKVKFPASTLTQQVIPFRPFPIDALPAVLERYVNGTAKAMGCDESYIALPLLSVLAAVIGNSRRVKLKRGWTEPAILWTAIVGESGTLKTPAMRLVLRPLKEIQRESLEEHAEAVEQYKSEQLQYEKKLSAWKRDKNESDPPGKPEPPQATRQLVSDVTVEAIAPILAANPRGVLLENDELAGWFGSFDRYAHKSGAGADAAHWLSMYTGETITVDRKSATEPIFVPRASVSICGGIQPGTLRRSLGAQHRESGLAARFLLAFPPRRARRWTDSDIDPKLEESYKRLLERLFALQMGSYDGQLEPTIVTMTEAGQAAWINFFEKHNQEQNQLNGDLASAWSKLEGYTARFALILHLVRQVLG